MTIVLRGERLQVEGEMTLDTATRLLEEGSEALVAPETVVDLAGVTEVDSSGLAVLFGWQRAAQSVGRSIRVENPPDSLLSLAGLYGVSDLLPLG